MVLHLLQENSRVCGTNQERMTKAIRRHPQRLK